MYHNKYYNNTI